MVSLSDLERLRSLGLAVEPGLALPVIRHFRLWKEQGEALALGYVSDVKVEDVHEIARLLPRIGRDTGDPACEALASWASGNIWHFSDQSLPALKAFAQAVTLYSWHGTPTDCARVQVGTISAFNELGRHGEAVELGKRTIRELASSADPDDLSRLAAAQKQTGIAYAYLGQFAQALRWFGASLTTWEKLESWDLDRAKKQRARTLNGIALLHVQLGLYDEAVAEFERARDLLSAYVHEPKSIPDLARIQINLARLLSQITEPWQYEIVDEAFRLAREWRVMLNAQVADTDLAFLDLYEASWLIQTNRHGAVDHDLIVNRREHCAALGLAKATQYADFIVGQLALLGGDVPSAINTFGRIITRAEDTSGASIEMDFPAKLWLALSLHADGQSDAAERALKESIERAENLGQSLTDDILRAGYSENTLIAYQHLTSWRDKVGDAGAAFMATERAKGRTLVEMLDAVVADHAREPSAGVDSARLTFPPEDIATLLPENTLAIAYAVVLGKVWAFLLDRGGLLEVRRDMAVPLTFRELRTGLDQIEAAKGIARSNKDDLAGARILAQVTLGKWYRRYLAPLQSVLDRYHTLLIAPDGLVNHLPFNGLYNPSSKRYLIETHTIQLVPSLATFKLLAERQRQRQRSQDAKATDATVPLMIGYSSGGRLPHAREEAEFVSRLFQPSTLLPEQAATSASFVKHASSARWIYLASHGEYVARDPLRSFIELSDQPLKASDILNLHGRLQARAVVLSACESGKGYLKGNEMMGLVRAFLHAGADAVLGTHWCVEDRTTFELGAEFARQLKSGKSFASALKLAQTALLRADQASSHAALHSHPYYWAGLTLVGLDAVP